MEICRINFRNISEEGNDHCYNNKKILIIDDEPYNCAALCSLIKGLKLENYN